MSRQAKVAVHKFNPRVEHKPRFQTYRIPFQPKMTILDSLNYIYEKLDPSFAYPYGCRYGCCGSCSVRVNGVPKLICQENILAEMKIEPLNPYQIIRDLIIDRDLFYAQTIPYQPFLLRSGNFKGKNPEVLDQGEFEIFNLVSGCITCLSCDSECPIKSKNFAGPSFFVHLARYFFDPRDRGKRRGIKEKAEKCSECGKCEMVCPKGISIVKIIRQIKGI